MGYDIDFTLNINSEFRQMLFVRDIDWTLSELLRNEFNQSAAFEDKT